MLEVYLDLMMLLNFGVDLLLLMGTNRLTGYPTCTGRVMAAAALGGFYSGLCLFRNFRFLGGMLWRCIFLILMAALAFGWNRSLLRRGAVFVLLTMTLGGVAQTLNRPDTAALLLSGCGLWLLCILGFGDGIGKREYVPVCLSRGNRVCNVIALRDSGNTLRDPVTGEQVLVVSGAVAGKLTGLTPDQLRSPLETMTRNPGLGLRLIPYHAVGNPGSMMLGMRFADVRIGHQQCSAVVAFAPDGIGEGETHQALVAVGGL